MDDQRRGEPNHFQVAGNRLTLLVEPGARMEALLGLIRGAARSLRLLYYIYADDETGRRIRDELVAARARGVSVELIVDGFGSSANDAFFAPLERAGASVCRFIPRFGRRYLLRNHQKLAIADEARAMIGGFNIEDSYFLPPERDGWRDLGLLIEGPGAGRLTGYFDALAGWAKRPKARMRDLRRALRSWSGSDGAMRWLLGGPARRLNPWARAVKRDMTHARSAAFVVAYFAPSPGMLRRLDRIGRRGTAIVVTAAKSDNTTTIGAARFCYPGLLRKGVRIYEYQRTKLHTKLYVIDDAVHIGSANFDMRSLFLNLELMLRIEDPAFARRMRDYVEHEIGDSAPVTLADVTGWRTIFGRIRNAICYFLVAVLDYSLTRRLNFGRG